MIEGRADTVTSQIFLDGREPPSPTVPSPSPASSIVEGVSSLILVVPPSSNPPSYYGNFVYVA